MANAILNFHFDYLTTSLRVKADEAYLVGRGLAPVAAYLDVPGIIRIAQALFNLIIGINI